jgi:DnaJ-class molecular chaperone
MNTIMIIRMDERDEDSGYCPACNGSGEGGYDGSICSLCRGCGEINEPDGDEEIMQDWELDDGY